MTSVGHFESFCFWVLFWCFYNRLMFVCFYFNLFLYFSNIPCFINLCMYFIFKISLLREGCYIHSKYELEIPRWIFQPLKLIFVMWSDQWILHFCCYFQCGIGNVFNFSFFRSILVPFQVVACCLIIISALYSIIWKCACLIVYA